MPGSSKPYSVATLSPGLVLEHAALQDLLDEDAVLHDRRIRLAGCGIDRDLALPLDHQLALPGKAVVPDDGWRNTERAIALAQSAERAELELELARRRDRSIGAVVGTKRVRRQRGEQEQESGDRPDGGANHSALYRLTCAAILPAAGCAT
jgi:hypothetical protein